ncbi:MAG: hypothetical protein MUE60_08580 [Candidatus Eisenbacteria bacterium]|nr:hypothetical protein [Candidatus Eisenbacteria bacterium]
MEDRGGISLFPLVALLSGLFVSSPALVNPLFVATRIEKGALERGTVELVAAALPLAVRGCFVTTAVMLGFGFTVFTVERRYQAMIESPHHLSPQDSETRDAP